VRKAGHSDVRLHDPHHAFASVAAGAGMGLPIMGKMLGNTQTQSTQRYAHDPVKAAAATVAARIEEALRGSRSAEVVRLRRHAGWSAPPTSGNRRGRSCGMSADTNSNSLRLDAREPAPAPFAPRRHHRNARFPRCLLYAWAEALALAVVVEHKKRCRRPAHALMA
jgi:hypothetical protein